MHTIIDARAQREGRPSWRFLIGLLMVLTLAQMLVYHESFLVKPADDDFGGLNTDIIRGDMEGPWVFFTASNQAKNYRPLSSLIAWSAGRWSMPDPWLALHIATFACMAALGLCVLAWTRVLPLGRVGVTIVGVVTYFHPVITPQLGGADGLGGLLASASMWAGALAVYVHRERPWRAAIIMGFWLLLGGTTKEYALGLAPLAMLTAVAFPSRRRAALLIAVTLVIGMIAVGQMYVRQYAQLPGTEAKVPAPVLSLMQVAENLGLFAAVMTYFGHTAWVFLDRSLPMLLLFAASSGATLLLLLVGLWRGLRPASGAATAPARQASTTAAEIPAPVIARRWLAYFLLSVLPACFPANVMPHVSEMYAGTLIVPIALLAGLAAEGVQSLARPWRTLCVAVFAAQMVLAMVSITRKVSDLRDVGERTAVMLDQMDALVPRDAHDQVYAIVFLEAQVGAMPKYSIYRIPDWKLLLPGTRDKWNGAMVWIRPARNVSLETRIVKSLEEVDPAAYADVFVWDVPQQRFSPMMKESP